MLCRRTSAALKTPARICRLARVRPGVAVLLILATLGCVIAGIIMSRIVYANRIDDRYVRLKGCGEAFLAELPEFRPGAREY